MTGGGGGGLDSKTSTSKAFDESDRDVVLQYCATQPQSDDLKRKKVGVPLFRRKHILEKIWSFFKDIFPPPVFCPHKHIARCVVSICDCSQLSPAYKPSSSISPLKNGGTMKDQCKLMSSFLAAKFLFVFAATVDAQRRFRGRVRPPTLSCGLAPCFAPLSEHRSIHVGHSARSYSMMHASFRCDQLIEGPTALPAVVPRRVSPSTNWRRQSRIRCTDRPNPSQGPRSMLSPDLARRELPIRNRQAIELYK